ncbi:MAG TPA: sigma-70 family RNA polymerase sigma factor [Phycisphaerae bacterium]
MKRAAGGDRDARRVLFERLREPAYRVAYRVTGNHEDALDVVQDSFIKAFESLGDFQGQSAFKTWLLRIVTNRGLDHLRARKVRLATPIDPDSESGPLEIAAREDGTRPGDALERRELGARLQGAIEALPPEQRAVFALYAAGEMTYGQIAEVVGIPIGTVMSRLYHARRRLREMLGDLVSGES